MMPEIHQFYKQTENKDTGEKNSGPENYPTTFVHIFHKSYPRLPSIPLPKLPENGALDLVFKKRKSTREFLSKALSYNLFASTLNSCRILESNGEFERRTYPSAGARFPIEIYPIIFNVEGLERGAYHYNNISNNLELLLQEDLTPIATHFVSPFIVNPAAALILTSVIPRSEVKYGIKAYPFSLLEAGHIGQNISLSCAYHNIGCCAVGGLVDSTVIKVLDLLKNEIPLYSMALGSIE